MENNTLIQELIDLDIVDENSISEFYPKVRDNDGIKVLKCEKSGLIFLDKLTDVDYYENIPDFSYWNTSTREESLEDTKEDDERRFSQIKDSILNKSYLDIGCGIGGILDLAKTVASGVSAVEPQKEIRESLIDLGYNCAKSIDELIEGGRGFDFITLFHVLEHISNPKEFLGKVYELLNPGGMVFIEVPHANDILISVYDSESFKSHTFWSEHLVLHTDNSLKTYLGNAGFNNINVDGYQRYPLSNHLHWLNKNKPGGQNILNNFNNTTLSEEYDNFLITNKSTDTLIATATKIK